jgi:hypothetical protein
MRSGVAIRESSVKVETKWNEKRCRKGKHQRKVQKYSNAVRREGWEKWRKKERKEANYGWPEMSVNNYKHRLRNLHE